MDTPETYIKMCEKAEEIQAQAPDPYSTEGIGYPLFGEPVTLIHKEHFVYLSDNTGTRAIWLPTQGQLQEMVGKALWHLNGAFYEWLFSATKDGWHINHNHLHFTSMEQLWLAFVMKEKYNKVWDGERWVSRGVVDVRAEDIEVKRIKPEEIT